MKSIAKQGFGLLEVLIAAVVLGFLIVGMNIMQKGNREAVLRIRSRDAAQIIAQDFLDSLSSLGISSIQNIPTKTKIAERNYEWTGGKDGGITAKITYTIEGTITDDEENNKVTERSEFIDGNIVHTVSKNCNLTVSWQFKNSTQPQSITVSRIIK